MGSRYHLRSWSLTDEEESLPVRVENAEDFKVDDELMAHLGRSPVLQYSSSTKRPGNPMARSLDTLELHSPSRGSNPHSFFANNDSYSCSPLSKRRRNYQESPNRAIHTLAGSVDASNSAWKEWSHRTKNDTAELPKNVTSSLNEDLLVQKRRCISPVVTLERHERYRESLPLRLDFSNARASRQAATPSPVRQFLRPREPRSRGSDGLSPLREMIRRQRLN